MRYYTLLKAGIKQHRSVYLGILLLITVVSFSLSTVLSIWSNSKSYIEDEMNRAGFGTVTAWVNNTNNLDSIVEQIERLENVEKTNSQPLIFSDYTIGREHSDSEGQLLPYKMDEKRYRIFNKELSGYLDNVEEISSGEIYASTSLVSTFGLKFGDEISFLIARNGASMKFKVKGFFEDPFMGSSMIGMKSFLICEKDYLEAINILKNSGIDSLARSGAMIHIFQSIDDKSTVSEFTALINENTNLTSVTESVHSFNAISGFMTVLQNIYCGFLFVFVFILMIAILVVIGRCINCTIEEEYSDLGILKVVGYTGKQLKLIQVLQYFITSMSGIIIGTIGSLTIRSFVNGILVTTTGFLLPSTVPFILLIISFTLIIALVMGYVLLKTRLLNNITPLNAIQKKQNTTFNNSRLKIKLDKKNLLLNLSLRQVWSNKTKYISACLVAALLVLFSSAIGRVNVWLGPNGEGMMDAFNPADHDIGVQPIGNITYEQIENIINDFSEINDEYILGMPSVAINGVSLTANVISEPNRFHITQGNTCVHADEIVITEFVASDLGIGLGDTVQIQADKGSGKYRVAGIYQCANDMGENIGMNQEGYLQIGKDSPHIWCHHLFLSDTSRKQEMIDLLTQTYGGNIYVHENSWPGLYGIINAMHALIIFMYVISAVFILIVTLLTSNRIINAEKKNLGIYKAIGFTNAQLAKSISIRFLVVSFLGGIIGSIFAMTLSDKAVSILMKLEGISNFSSELTFSDSVFPVFIVVALYTIISYISSNKKIKTVNVIELISE